jgi:hypothetical protein
LKEAEREVCDVVLHPYKYVCRYLSWYWFVHLEYAEWWNVAWHLLNVEVPRLLCTIYVYTYLLVVSILGS